MHSVGAFGNCVWYDQISHIFVWASVQCADRSQNLSSAPQRLQQLLLKLQGYNYTLDYLQGSEMTIAETLSRLPNEKESQTIDLDIQVDHVKFSTDGIEYLCRYPIRAPDPVLQELTNIVLIGWPNSI